MLQLYTFERAELDRLADFERKQAKAARTAEARKHMEDAGFVQVSAWVRHDQRSDVVSLLRFLHEHPEFSAGPARHIMTGRLRRY